MELPATALKATKRTKPRARPQKLAILSAITSLLPFYHSEISSVILTLTLLGPLVIRQRMIVEHLLLMLSDDGFLY